jgi:hypothetical protein
MSRWNDQFQNHIFRTTWNALNALLAEKDLEKNSDAAAIKEIARLCKVVKYIDWHTTIGRIPFSIILFVPAFYLARESNKHRNTEVLNRRRELILSTIDPYLALLDGERAQQIKLDIAKGIFSEGNLSTTDASKDEMGNLIAQITNLIKQAR